MWFGLTRAFQNSMTQTGRTKDHRAAPPEGNGLGAGLVLPGVFTNTQMMFAMANFLKDSTVEAVDNLFKPQYRT